MRDVGSRRVTARLTAQASRPIKDRINMARAAYEEYSESDGTSVIDFALDVLLFAQSEHAADSTLLPRLAKQALREWARSKRLCSLKGLEPTSRSRFMTDEQKETVYDLKDFVHDHLENLVDRLDDMYTALGCIGAAEIRLQQLKQHIWDSTGAPTTPEEDQGATT